MAGDRPVTRRQVLQGAASAAVVAGVGTAVTPMVVHAAQVTGDEIAVRMAMHIHASFSEGIGSMQAHLAEAERIGVDVIWWTEHDHRMVARGYLNDVHFTGLSEYTGGVSLTWQSTYAGQLASSSVTFGKPGSVNDPGDSAMHMTALSSGGPGGTRTMTASPRNYALTTSLDGTTIELDVRPVEVGEDAWFDVVLDTSYRPATGGRPPGQYRLRYRVGGGRPVGTITDTDPLAGLVVVDAPTNSWTTLSLDPVADMSHIWPDIDFRDAALTEFSFAVTSRNSTRSTTSVDGLHFVRTRKHAKAVLGVQRELMEHYTPLYPTVVQRQGVELSQSTPHVNWFGDPDIWPASDPAHYDVELAIEKVHAADGVASYNHPFGTSGGPYSTSTRTSKRRSMASAMVTERAFGADIVEVGYTDGRAGMLQSDYIGLWDVMSRNLVFATGTGVTDDHRGVDWIAQRWRHVTGVWATSTDLPDLQAALRAGRAWFFDPAVYNGTLDVTGAEFVPMGSAGLVDTDMCTLTIRATDVPSDWRIVVVSGLADEAGTSALDPEVTSRSVPASDLVAGKVKVRVHTDVSSFHRVALRDAEGTVRAYGNPLWLLRSLPYAGVPDERWALPDVVPTATDGASPTPETPPQGITP